MVLNFRNGYGQPSVFKNLCLQELPVFNYLDGLLIYRLKFKINDYDV